MNTQPRRDQPHSALELWHPAGLPARRLSIGGPAAADDEDAGAPADFVLVAASSPRPQRGWLGPALRLAASSLNTGGLVCIVVPPRARRAVGNLVRDAGLVPVGELLTWPPGPGCAHAASIDAATLRSIGPRLHLGAAVRLGFAALVRARAGRRVARGAAQGYALLAARPSTPPPLDWLRALDGTPGQCRATVSIGPRGDARVAVVLRFASASSAPDIAVKVALDEPGQARIDRERVALAGLGSGARRAGAAVPELVATATRVSGTMTTSALPGRPASFLIGRDRRRAPSILEPLIAWLGRWGAATASSATARPALTEELLLAPAERLCAAGGGPDMSRYLDALRGLAARLDGCRVALSAAHNDLTMSNVLVDVPNLGIVDWESACPAAPPLMDLWYALADGVARAGRLRHGQAVAALAGGRAPISAALAAAPDAAARARGLTADESLLSFHACWLHHAGNELDRGNRAGVFAQVVRTVAAQRLRWPAGQAGRPR